MTFATFFLSTGRCGTQWIAKKLDEHYSDIAVVEHEPLFVDYIPKQLIGIENISESDNRELIEDHAADIEDTLKDKNYIECGWPCYGALRYFAKRFEGRIRIVHLTRHPTPTSCSLVTHAYYHTPSREIEIDGKGLLTPFDPGVIFPEIGQFWNKFSRQEKCLYFWAEINALGLKLEKELAVPWLRLRMEDLFQGNGLDELLPFLELPKIDRIYDEKNSRIDAFRVQTKETLRGRVAARHPYVVKIAEELGYDVQNVDLDELGNRYVKVPRRNSETH